jgi:DNA (cytosine-5)-methyltransferase 1
MKAYYNEIDPFAAEWLRVLIREGHIADGVVDTRSIVDVEPNDLMGFSQCHFFAGIGGWSYALRLAGWADDRPVWTGSCPCQPFSTAGKQRGTDDERHLWPEFARLIGQCKPTTVFGEQVASAAGRDWLGAVRLDLEAMGYAVGAADLCAAGVGAPHIRQRLYWGAQRLADTYEREQRTRGRTGRKDTTGNESWTDASRRGEVGRLGDPIGAGLEGHARHVADGHKSKRDHKDATRSTSSPSALSEFWSKADYHRCSDGKYRPFESSIQPMAPRIPQRVAALRGAGNAIVSQVAQAFIECFDQVSGLI